MSTSRLGPEPRVNAKYLSEHKGQHVRLTAKVTNLVGETATVQASDGGEVALQMTRTMHMEEGSYVEIIGVVRDDLTVRAENAINLGNKLDMKTVDAVVEFGHSSKGQGVLA